MSDEQEKSFRDKIREIDQKEKEAQNERDRTIRENREAQERQQQEEYEKRLRQEKVELMRLKQGIITESDVIVKEETVVKNYTFKEKLSSFVYLNKLWIIMISAAVVIAAFMIYSLATTVRPDTDILFIATDYELSQRTEKIEELMQKYAADLNDDGKVYVSVAYMPVDNSKDTKVMQEEYRANMTKLMALFQMDSSMLIVSDNKIVEQVGLGEELDDLTKRYPDKDNVNKYGILLKDTNFGKEVGYDGFTDDLFIGIRRVYAENENADRLKKSYDDTITVLDKFMKDLG